MLCGNESYTFGLQEMENYDSGKPIKSSNYTLLSKAEKFFNRALENYNIHSKFETTSAEIFIKLGNTKYQLGLISLGRGDTNKSDKDFRAAVAYYNRALAIDNNNVQALVGRGKAIIKFSSADIIESTSNSIADYSTAIRINPSFVDAYLERAALYLLPYTSEMESNCRRSKDIKYLNSIFCDTHTANKAIVDLSKAIKISPANYQAFLDLCKAKYYYGQYEAEYYLLGTRIKRDSLYSAIDSCSHAIEIDSYNPKGYFNRALISYSLERYREAIEDLSKAIRLRPNYIEALNLRKEMRETLGDIIGGTKDTIILITYQIQETPEDPSLYFMRAESREKINDYQGACDDYKKIALLTRTSSDKQENYKSIVKWLESNKGAWCANQK